MKPTSRKISELFMVTFTINILIATSTNMFANKETWLDKLGYITGQWYGFSLVILTIAYLFFISIDDKLKCNDLMYYFRLLGLNLIFSGLMMLGCMFPDLMNYLFVLVIPFGITGSFIMSLLLMLDLAANIIIKKYHKEI